MGREAIRIGGNTSSVRTSSPTMAPKETERMTANPHLVADASGQEVREEGGRFYVKFRANHLNLNHYSSVIGHQENKESKRGFPGLHRQWLTSC
jgi:hypothetical protein